MHLRHTGLKQNTTILHSFFLFTYKLGDSAINSLLFLSQMLSAFHPLFINPQTTNSNDKKRHMRGEGGEANPGKKGLMLCYFHKEILRLPYTKARVSSICCIWGEIKTDSKISGFFSSPFPLFFCKETHLPTFRFAYWQRKKHNPKPPWKQSSTLVVSCIT